ncbi:phage tail tip lysozyme [Streptomyces sp. H27-H1]|uniref:phage tail tip lysozyme n=1 Tax=Streptomyces sp. H27-H1 TaxID=2996461 RepID=UPI00226E31FC|nr:phage tail tip lysozyme [Streptomyces sp. H27-H1]MCY0929633.1 phage tail tip lysozyme [Streptomyces sp. H27-H1]
MAADQPNRSSKKGTTKDQPDASVSQRMPRQGRGTKSLGHKEDVEKPPSGKTTVLKQFPGREADSSGPSGPSGTANTAPKMSEAGSKIPDSAGTAGRTAGGTKAGGTKAEATKAGATKAGGTKAEATKAGGTKAGGTKAEATKAGGTNTEAANPGAANPEATKAEATKAGGTKAEAANPEATKAGAANAGATFKQGMNGVAGNLAGGATQKAIEGDGSSATRRNVGRYAGAAVSGAVAGAQAGGLPGAAVGAAKNVAVEGAQDAVKGASKATGGSPDAKSADQRELGVGGTGYERGATKDGEGLGSKVAKGVAVGGGAAAAPPAVGVIMAMALLNWLKSMFFAAMAMAVNAGKLLWTLIVNIVKAVGHAIAAPFMAIGSFIAKGAGAVLGITVTATMAPVAAAMSGAVAVTATVALLGTVLTGVLNSTALTEGGINANRAACAVNAGGVDDGSGATVPAGVERNAKEVYSVLSSWGMPKANIAGILGNWSQESGIDPTSVQNFPTGTYAMTPAKASAAQNTDNGIGLGQWTFGRNTLLRQYTQGKGVDWFTIKAQLAFMVDGDNPGDVAVFKDMLRKSQGSPRAAALHFHENWERSADGAAGIAARGDKAEMWFGKMSGWSVDSSIVGGVEDIVGGIIENISNGIDAILGNCTSTDGGSVSPKDGGMTQEEAQALVDLFNKEGDKFLDGRYGPGGGPGSCGDNHAMNCVSFSTYFVNKYTTFQAYPSGDGKETAYTIARETGKTLQSTPAPYSVGSGPGSTPVGHTLVVLGVQGDKVILGEAGYCAYMGRVRVASAAQMAAQGWKFVDMSDAMLTSDKIKEA